MVFTGADHGVERGVEQDYQRALPVADALREEVLLAYEMNGAPLLPQHGAPLRLIVPGWYGMAHVKWLRSISVRTEPFDGYQNAVAYRLRRDADDPGVPVTRIEPRALVRPPGFPDFMSRRRVLRPGPCTVDGRAWSGHAPGGRGGGDASTAGRAGRRPSWTRRRAGSSPGGGGGTSGRRRRAGTCWARGRPTRPGGPSRSSSRGTVAASPTTWCSGSRSSYRPSDRAVSLGWGARPARRVGQLPKPESAGSEMSGFSSSSTLTSLKVITRTFFTNRAGRYMSQTQASCISTSK